ncbi:CCA tRNA nucleotidyltransferase [Spirochaetia bacterium 38H-sp]|uniref:CCA tRNA nucleotidyltransferase n=1 Tax=Rarispira pelagica TaxID=3141764 RepID=A0ABU9UAR4_9SPIR
MHHYKKAPFKIKKLPETLIEIANTLKKNKHQCYIVGGAVRDIAMGKEPDDYDLASSATPEEIKKIFKKVIPTGIQHGTVTILIKRDKYEITTFREEEGYTDLRHPDKIRYTRSLETDLSRRDFTINALALDPITEEIYDLYQGYADIKKKIIKTVGQPDKRFEEDALRILRAIRFAAQLGFTIEKETYKAIKRHSKNIQQISWERIREEFTKVLLSPSPSLGIKLMEETEILQYIIPELLTCKNISQGKAHRFDVYHHLLASCDLVEKKDIIIKLAALFHDIGKPITKIEIPGKGLAFYDHDKESAKIAKKILKRLKYPNSTIEKVTHLIQNHMIKYTEDWTDAAIRRHITRIGKDNLDQLLELLKADRWGITGTKTKVTDIEALRYRINTELNKSNALTIKDLKINGNTLQETLEIPAGPWIGKILKYLMEAVLDDPKLNTKEKLIEIAKKYYKKYN